MPPEDYTEDLYRAGIDMTNSDDEVSVVAYRADSENLNNRIVGTPIVTSAMQAISESRLRGVRDSLMDYNLSERRKEICSQLGIPSSLMINTSTTVAPTMTTSTFNSDVIGRYWIGATSGMATSSSSWPSGGSPAFSFAGEPPLPPKELTLEELKAWYDEVYDANEGMFAVCRHIKRDGVVTNKEWGFVNKYNTIVNPIIYEDIRFFTEGRAAVMRQGKWGFVSKNYPHLYISAEFQDVAAFSEDIVAVTRDGIKWLYIDDFGTRLTPTLYDECLPFKYGWGIVIIGEEWGMVNKKGQLVLNVIYDKVDVVMTEEGCINVLVTILGHVCVLDEDLSEIN